MSKPEHNLSVLPSVLIVSGCASHPGEGGNRKRLLNLAISLREIGWRPVLLYTDFLPGDITAMRKWWAQDHYYQPYRPGSSMWMLKRLARRFLPEHGGLRSWHRSRLYGWGTGDLGKDARTDRVSVDSYYEPAVDAVIDRLHQQYCFRAVIAQFVIMSRALLRFPGYGVKKLIDTHEVFALGEAWKTAPPAKLWLKITPEEELMALNRADTALAIQGHDAKTMRKAGVNASVVGHSVEVVSDPEMGKALASRNILFVSRGHPFDIAGLEWFAREVFPKMSSWLKPQQVIVVGMIKHVMLNRPPFTFLGRVDNLPAVYADVRAVIAPLHEGTGLKIKVVEALGFGRALIATPFAVLGVEDGAHTAFAVAESATEVAAGLKRIMSDDAECKRLMAGAIAYARKWNREQAQALRAVLET